MTETSFEGKRIVITGGTGSLGRRLTNRILSGERGVPEKVIIFSRDEARQHQMRLDFLHRGPATDEIIFKNFEHALEFRIGDIRNRDSVASVLRGVDIVFNAAAMKQVPTCEYFPYEAVRTNVEGAENIVWAIESNNLPVEVVVGISTDKACKPVNVMGMTKAIQERVFIQGNMRCNGTRFVGVRYGNVLASRGSVIPLFHDQIRRGGPVTVTTAEMTRFLLSLDAAVNTVFAAIDLVDPGEILVPDVPAALVINIAKALIDGRDIATVVTGIRPGEKTHEIMISEEEAPRTVRRDRWIAIRPMLPELLGEVIEPVVTGEFSSATTVLDLDATRELLHQNDLMVEDGLGAETELLR
jgi:FlaA1/EpsC-like NDP-sugar epimerase